MLRAVGFGFTLAIQKPYGGLVCAHSCLALTLTLIEMLRMMTKDLGDKPEMPQVEQKACDTNSMRLLRSTQKGLPAIFFIYHYVIEELVCI